MKDELVTYTNPKSTLAEMFKTLRTNVQFMTNGDELKTILITSTLPGEGKSWTTSNLAVTFAQAGKRVVVVDADMRKGRQFSIFKTSPRLGLSNYLSGVTDESNIANKNDLSLFIKHTEIKRLDLIPAGDVPPNPSELLISSRMKTLLEELKRIYDLVIVDAPPSLLVTDAIILSRIVDNTLIVASHKETKTDDLNKIKKAIENVGGKVAGIVINRMPSKQGRYQYGYYANENSLSHKRTSSLKKMKENVSSKEKEAARKATTRTKTSKDNKAIILEGATSSTDTNEILKQIAKYLQNEEKK